MSNRKNRKGMSLIELLIVVGVLGVIFAAVYLFFTKGTEQFHFARRQNELATSGRLALEILTDEIRWAGYMPRGGWSEDQWHPIEVGANTSLEFYADRETYRILEDSDHRNIFLGADGTIQITDDGSMLRRAGHNIVDIEFNYMDYRGVLLTKPLDTVARDAVRHIEVKITLEDTYLGDVYQTVMKTTVTPMNLGVVHNFDPLFYQPPPIDANVVVNVDGNSGAHSPTIHQTRLVELLDDWGFSTVQLSDDELADYSYDSSGVDLVILRNVPLGDHTAVATEMQMLTIPVICLDPDDAENLFGIGVAAAVQPLPSICELLGATPTHPIHDGLPEVGGIPQFTVYDTLATVTRLDTLFNYASPIPGNDPYVITCIYSALPADTVSGVSVRYESPNELLRRLHYCAPDFYYYSWMGERFLRNVIFWALPEAAPPDLGDEIETEGFEGEELEDVFMTLLDEDLEGGILLPDSTPIYYDFQQGDTHEMTWNTTSTGAGRIARLADNTLEMDRSHLGSFDRNIATTVTDLSGYSSFSDELYIKVDTWKGTSETINAEDGLFLITSPGSATELFREDFESFTPGSGVEFWENSQGRHRVHSPGWNNGTAFVTLDTSVSNQMSDERMIIEVDTSTLSDSSSITVFYRISSHNDENQFISTTEGDFIGWSLGSGITDPVEDYQILYPESMSDGQWYSMEYSFIPAGTMPSTLYIVFSHRGNDIAVSETANDGLSFDDVVVVANAATITMERIGVPSDNSDWQTIRADLDDEAFAHGVPFSGNFGIGISQYGMGSWPSHGMHWRNFEVGVIEMVHSIPGWSHGPLYTGGVDDWFLENISGNYKWTLHSNNPAAYSNSSECWLKTPQLSIPVGAKDAQLSFNHSINFENNCDYGWIMVSTNGGASWQHVDAPGYNGVTGGHGAYTGTHGTLTEQIDLTPWVGQTIQFMFFFQSDGANNYSGWVLDDFEATCTVTGVSIESIGFKSAEPAGAWHFNTVDVWLGGVTDVAFPDDGEWDKGTLTYAGTYEVLPPASGDWVEIVLNDSFLLPEATNLLVKLEMNQAAPTVPYEWYAGSHADLARRAVSSVEDPALLVRADIRPSFMISTASGGIRYIDQDSTGTASDMPLASQYQYGDFEAIYLMDEFGFTGEITWEHGGVNDDWEFGTPIFTPDPDPNLAPENKNRIAGNDLTVDGRYDPESWNWLRSCAYSMADALIYDSIAVSYDRCLRRSYNDKAYVFIAFTDTVDPPTSESDWILLKECDYYDTDWVTDIIDLTQKFEEAEALGRNYYFIRFVLDSGIYSEDGGWNIDNVGFYGRNAI
ncbi:hypothetical protein CSA37_06295 [Candidatus Fermentibacteria bacterium]|nr:MAG: hypothetical protein CSA37_06295 [Candidatus Fermentibacteria bacterium]